MTGPDPETRRRALAVFDEALDLPEPQRNAFLDRVCAGDPALRREVEDLFAADSRAGGPLDTPASEHAAALLDPEDPGEAEPLPPDIPPYRFLHVVGRGGMGTVYRAERADGQFEQSVALKLVHPGALGTRGILDRFLRERRILARLEHPNIARLLDGGVTEAGVPYFAMEFVEGERITDHADRAGLAVEERLALFEQVCEAVAYAQTRLVVHRDLKPSNILVTAGGMVKLLDFGIARILSPDDTASRELTIDGVSAFTPEYAAPEQIRGEAPTTATDVYALGALLHELLTGRRPLRRGAAGAARWADGPLDTEPEPISRGVDRTLRRRLAGDLDVIVGRALRTRPEERYPTAQAMLEDIRRHRRSEPIAARPPSLRYRAGRYLRRHRVGVGAAALVTLALLAGVAGTAWQARLAAREAERANRVKDFLAGIFRESDPDRAQGHDPTASEILARGAERIELELRGDPEVRSELELIVGRVYDELGNYDAARPLAERSLATRRLLHGDDHPSTAESMEFLATTHARQAEYAQAESLYRMALAIERRHRNPHHPRLAAVGANLAGVLSHLGAFAEAETLYREAIAIDSYAYGEDHWETAQDLNNLAVHLGRAGRHEEAETLDREALRIRRLHAEDRPTELAMSLHNAAHGLVARGRSAEAIPLYRESIALKRKLYEANHPSLARSLRSLGAAFRNADDLDSAAVCMREALVMQRTLLGEEHEEVGITRNELAILSYLQGDLAEAVAGFREALAVFEALLPPDHPTVLTLRNNIATIEMSLGNLAAAEAAYRRILEIRTVKLGEAHPDVGQTWLALGNVRRWSGDLDGAVENYLRVLDVYRKAYDEENVDVASTLVTLARARIDRKEYAQAEAHLEDALAVLRTHLAPDHRDVVFAEAVLGCLFVRTGRAAEGLPLLERAAAASKERYGADDVRAADSSSQLALCLVALGRAEEGRPRLEAALPTLESHYGTAHPATREVSAALSRLGT